jgi:hypothetical protein
MSTASPHPKTSEKTLFGKVISACLVPVGWMVLGAVCYWYKTDLSRKAGFFLIFVGIVSLVYNLLRVRRRHAEKKKGLHL